MTSPACMLLLMLLASFAIGEEDVWKEVMCDEKYLPDNCDFRRIPLLTVEDYERCAPASLPLYARNYFLGWAGRGVTYRENRNAFGRIKIRPKMLREVLQSSLEITTLDQKVAFPVGIAPTAFHKFANPQGENATAAAAAAMNTIMILSCYSTIPLEEVAASVRGSSVHLWMQLYIFNKINLTIDLVRRAERNGFKAIVLTVDSNTISTIMCDAKSDPMIKNRTWVNFPSESIESLTSSVTTFKHISWLRSITKLPIIAKGILNGADAQMAIQSGATAIMVSNHGGRQLDYVPATIDVLAEVVDAVNKMVPRRDVYMDGGVRNGFDVYNALARGAKMVFIGRPILWGLAMGGREGVIDVLNILKTEFNDTMLASGASNPSQIRRDTIHELSQPLDGYVEIILRISR